MNEKIIIDPKLIEEVLLKTDFFSGEEVRARIFNLKPLNETERKLGTKSVFRIKELIKNGEMFEAFISIFLRIEYALMRNLYYCERDIKSRPDKLKWEILSNLGFYKLSKLNVGFKLINKSLYKRIDKLREFRNEIFHNLVETKKEINKEKIKEYVEEGIKIYTELELLFTKEFLNKVDMAKKEIEEK